MILHTGPPNPQRTEFNLADRAPTLTILTWIFKFICSLVYEFFIFLPLSLSFLCLPLALPFLLAFVYSVHFSAFCDPLANCDTDDKQFSARMNLRAPDNILNHIKSNSNWKENVERATCILAPATPSRHPAHIHIKINTHSICNNISIYCFHSLWDKIYTFVLHVYCVCVWDLFLLFLLGRRILQFNQWILWIGFDRMQKGQTLWMRRTHTHTTFSWAVSLMSSSNFPARTHAIEFIRVARIYCHFMCW